MKGCRHRCVIRSDFHIHDCSDYRLTCTVCSTFTKVLHDAEYATVCIVWKASSPFLSMEVAVEMEEPNLAAPPPLSHQGMGSCE